jgi:outer membrane protein
MENSLIFRSWVGALFFPIAVSMMATEAQSDTVHCDLVQCIRYALDKSSDLEVAKLELEASEAGIRHSRAAFRPDLKMIFVAKELHGEPTGSFSVLDVREAEIERRSVNYEETGTLTLDFSYPLFTEGSFLGINAPTVASSITDRDELHWTEKLTRQEIIYGVTEGFLNAVSLGETVRLAEQELRIAKERLSVIERQVSLNLKPESESEIARAQLMAGTEALASAERDFEIARIRLGRLIGLGPLDEITISETYPPPPDLLSLNEMLESTGLLHPDFGIQKANLDRARAERDLASSERWASLVFESNFVYADDFDPPGNNSFQALLRLDVPLFDFGKTRAAIQESQLLVRAEEKRMDSVRDAIQKKILQAYSDIKAEEGRIAVLANQVTQAELDLRYDLARHKQGLIGKLEVLGTEGLLVDQKELLHEARMNRLRGYADLQLAAGGTWNWVP